MRQRVHGMVSPYRPEINVSGSEEPSASDANHQYMHLSRRETLFDQGTGRNGCTDMPKGWRQRQNWLKQGLLPFA